VCLLGTAVQGHQQRGLQEAQTQHEIDMKRRRKRIALEKGLQNAAPRLVQARVVGCYSDVAARAEGERSLDDGVNSNCGFIDTANGAGIRPPSCGPGRRWSR